jgi:lipid kinase YegS
MSARKAMLILHGKQAQNEAVRAAVQARRQSGWQLDVRLTWEGGDARRVVDEALAAGYPLIIAGGGDGTLGEVASCLARAGAPASLLMMPLGTANDFARAAGLSLEPEQALALMDSEPHWVDMGQMNGDWFLNMATGGFGSQVTANTSEDLKKVLGGAAYLVTGLARLAEVGSVSGRFSGPDFTWEGNFLAFGVGNGRQAGGGQLLCPEALIDDGLLDLCIVPAAEDTMGTLGTMLSGRLRGVESIAVSARLPWVELEVADGVDINLDGEPQVCAKMRFTVGERALRLHLPEDSVLLQGAPEPTTAENSL